MSETKPEGCETKPEGCETKPEGCETKPEKVICIITHDELSRLITLTSLAQKTPVIVTGGEGEQRQFDCSGAGWRKVRDMWEELGRKYAFDPAGVVLKPATREILEDEKVRKANLAKRFHRPKKRHGNRNQGHGRRKR